MIEWVVAAPRWLSNFRVRGGANEWVVGIERWGARGGQTKGRWAYGVPVERWVRGEAKRMARDRIQMGGGRCGVAVKLRGTRWGKTNGWGSYLNGRWASGVTVERWGTR